MQALRIATKHYKADHPEYLTFVGHYGVVLSKQVRVAPFTSHCPSLRPCYALQGVCEGAALGCFLSTRSHLPALRARRAKLVTTRRREVAATGVASGVPRW
jgi:hypothetical protein